MSTKTLIKGTFILTITGLISRIMGFYYRIFLSDKIGAVNLGIYQMIFPLVLISHTLTSCGIQLVISRLVAAHNEENAETEPLHPKHILATGLLLSLFISIAVAFLFYECAGFLAVRFLSEPACEPFVRILAALVPCSAIHTCIVGYYIGLEKTTIPALSNLTEQIVRILSVFLLYTVSMQEGRAITPAIAVYGLVLGEAGAVLLCVTALSLENKLKPISHSKKSFKAFRRLAASIFKQSLPLSGNRLLLNLLQSIEAVMIPAQLIAFGHSRSESFAIYGVLTGMAMPFVFFPSTLTNALSTVLLPDAAKSQNNRRSLAQTTERTLRFCLLLGIFCGLLFFVFGKPLGKTVFHNELCGRLLVVLGWLSPFMYITSTFSSILQGLGKVTQTFLVSLLSVSGRILFAFLLIPKFSILGYLWGLLACQIFSALVYCIILRHYTNFSFHAMNYIVKPVFYSAISLCIGRGVLLLSHSHNTSILIVCIITSLGCYGLLLLLSGLLHEFIPAKFSTFATKCPIINRNSFRHH